MTQWCSPLAGVWRPLAGLVQCGGGVFFVECLRIAVLMGLWWWACGCRSCVWGFLQGGLSAWVWDVWNLSKPSLLGGGPQPKFVGETTWGWVFWHSGFLLVPLPCGFWFSCGGLDAELVSAGLFLYLFVGLMAFWTFCWWGSSIVLHGAF